MRLAMVVIAGLLALLGAAAPASAGPFEDAMAIVSDPAALAKRSDEARKLFRQVCTSDPANVYAWYNLGLLSMLDSDLRGAEEAWKGALTAKADFLPAKARLAWIQYLRGGKDAAVAELERIVEADRYQPEARNLLAQVAIDKGDYDGAITHARNVLLGDPDNANAYLNLAVAYFRKDLVDQAWLITKNALDRRPQAAALHNLMGLIYLEKDDSRHATESFLRALEEDPRHVDAKLNLAALELAYGDFQTALGRFDEVLKARPDDVMVALSRAVALRGLKRYDEAESAYEDVLRKRPDMPEALYNLCVLHGQYTSKWERAQEYCRRYAGTIDKSHPKWREVQSRLKSIQATLEALRSAPPAAPEPDTAPPGDGG